MTSDYSDDTNKENPIREICAIRGQNLGRGEMSDELPNGCASAPVNEVFEGFKSGFAAGEKDADGGISHLRMNNIGLFGELNLDLVRRVPATLAKPNNDLHRGDLLVGMCACFDLPGRYTFSIHLTRLRPKPEMEEGRFLR